MVAKLGSQNSGRSGNDGQRIREMILDRASRFRVPDGKPAADALTLLKSKISEKEKGSVGNRSGNIKFLYIISSIAAGILLLFSIWQIMVRNLENEIVAENGTHMTHLLSDGSMVRLNAGSKIAWLQKKYAGERHIDLSGEAFFEVTKGPPFIVSTSNGDIKVLGTSFNVFSRDNSFKVSCFTGKVLVSANNRSVTLSPGESAELSENDLIFYPDKNINRTNSWIDGEFFYENNSLFNVLEEIERQFGVKFEAQDLKNKFFTGSFTDKDLKSALDIVCMPMGLKYEIGENNKIYITEINQ